MTCLGRFRAIFTAGTVQVYREMQCVGCSKLYSKEGSALFSEPILDLYLIQKTFSISSNQ